MKNEVKTHKNFGDDRGVSLRNIPTLPDQIAGRLRDSAQWLSGAILFLFLCAPAGRGQGVGTFVESGGLVVMAANHYQTNLPASGHAWIATNSPPGFASLADMFAAPHSGTSFSSVSTSPELAYPIVLTNSGAFKLWVRGFGPSSSSDSVYAGVDGQTPQALSFGADGAWVWNAVNVSVSNAGPHMVYVWMREDGAYLDRVLLSPATYTPSDTGPLESGQSVAGDLPPVVDITSPWLETNLLIGSTLQVSATASDPDGTVAAVNFYTNGVLAAAATAAPYGFSWTPAGGNYQLQAVAIDNAGSSAVSPPVAVTVNFPAPAGTAGTFAEAGGLVVMAANHFQTDTPLSGHVWLPTNVPPGFVSAADMFAMPVSGFSFGTATNSPELAYFVALTNSGTFRLWVRGFAPDNSSDSVYAGVDGNPQPVTFSKTNAWIWNSANVPIASAGPHKINLWMRQDGAYVDRLVLSPSTYTPTNGGPSEIGLAVQITSPANGARFFEYTTVPVKAQTSSPLIPVASVSFYVNSALKAVATNTPYSFNWVPGPGNYTLSATARDILGNTATSAPVSVTITTPPPATITYAPSSDTIYVGGGGVATLTQIASAVPHAPLTLVDPLHSVWFLGAKIIVQGGATLWLHGASVPGGDVSELRLKSDNVAGGTNNYVRLDADWGTLDLNGVRVISWDEATNGPDTEYTNYQRAFIRARSRLVGTNVQQSTLNVVNSEIGWLGFADSQSYGLTWEVVSNAPGVRVFGAVSGSAIHDCQLGPETGGSGDVNWTGDQIVSNTIYGFDPGSPAVQSAAVDNYVSGNTYQPLFRWSGSDQRIYVTGLGPATLSDIKTAVPSAALCLIDATNHVWFLAASLELSGGATLAVHGVSRGGDANELRLRSDNSTAGGSSVVIDADWGTLDFDGTKVVSWNQLAAAPDTEFTKFGRAFIRARSRMTTNLLFQPVAEESTLNFRDSELGWLGVNASDSFALDWQVVGSASGVNVFGTVSNSYIHDCQMGVASWFNNPKVYGSTVQWASNNINGDTLFGFDSTDPAQAAVLADNHVLGNTFAPIFRFANTDGRIYVTGRGDATLSDITNNVPSAPLTLVDPTNLIWELGSDLYVNNGAHLKLFGPAIGGDVGQLRLKSDHVGTNSFIVQLRADPGWLDIQSTKITSWNDALHGPDIITNIFTQPRSYIHARSTLDPNGHTAHEARMDVINSDIGYLGYHATETYGLTWKVVDSTAKFIPAGSTNSLYDLVKVYGDIKNSRLHNNCFGMYCYGAYGCVWTNDEVDHNLAYGFDPHNHSVNLDVENNNIHDNGWHGFIASVVCNNGILRNNWSYNNGQDLSQGRANGIMLHRSSGWLIENNLSYSNRDSGIAIFAANNNFISNNTCTGNGFTGIRLSVGARNNLVTGNQFLNTGGNGIYLFTGTNDVYSPYENETIHTGQYYVTIGTNRYVADEPTIRCQFNLISNNLINGTGLSSSALTNLFFSGLTDTNHTPEAIKVENSDSNVFALNLIIETNRVPIATNSSKVIIYGTNSVLRFFNATNNLVISNTLPFHTFAKLAADISNSIVVTKISTNGTTINVTNTIVHVLDGTFTTFASEPALALQVETNCVARFTDKGGAIFAVTNLPGQTNFILPSLTNTVSSIGSVASVTSALIGNKTNLVYARHFSALPASSSPVQIVVTTWDLAYPYNRVWTVKSSSSSVSITYRVGDLPPGSFNSVYRGFSRIATVTADANGFINFTSSPGTTSTVTYTVNQAPAKMTNYRQ